MIYDNILQTIGNTPVVRLNRMAPDNVEVYVKVESFNPMASVKDRLAFAIVNDALQRGVLEPGQTVVEATSGNTGIALAMVCAAKGYPLVVTMADSFSIERRKLMRFLGDLFLADRHQILGAADHAGSGATDLHVGNGSGRDQLEHEVKGGNFKNADIGHAQHIRDIFNRGLGDPAFLLLGTPQQRNNRRGLTPLGVFGELRFGPLLVVGREGKAFGLFGMQTTKH